MDKTYSRFLIYVPSELVRDSMFPFPMPAPNLSGNYTVYLRIDDEALVVYPLSPEPPKRLKVKFQLSQEALEKQLAPLIDLLMTRDQLQDYIERVREDHYSSVSTKLYQDRQEARFGPFLPSHLRTPLTASLVVLLDHYLLHYPPTAVLPFLQQRLAARPAAGNAPTPPE